MKGWFVTGTDTGVGKTYVSVALIRSLRAQGLRVAAMKPVASGCERTPEGLRNSDALALQAAASVPAPYAQVNPYAFEPPVSPHLAAHAAGVTIHLDQIEQDARTLAAGADALVVEGAGGWYAPLNDAHTMADLAMRLELPVVLVVGLRLGCLNHALLTVEAITARGAVLAGWVANVVDPGMQEIDANIDYLRAHLRAPLLAKVLWQGNFEIDVPNLMRQ